MPIPMKCGECGAGFRIKDEYAGKKGKCPKCQAIFRVPLPSTKRSQSDPPKDQVLFVRSSRSTSESQGAAAAGSIEGRSGAKTSNSSAGKSIVASKPSRQETPQSRATTTKRPAPQDVSPSKENMQAPSGFSLDEAVALAEQASGPTVDQIRAKIKKGFKGEFVKDGGRISQGTMLGAYGVVILLPVVFVAYILAIVGFIGWHAVANTQLLHSRDLGPFGWVFYGVPFIIGAYILLFIIKPFFAPRPRMYQERPVYRDNEPVLFEFCERVATMVGAPLPTEIVIDWEVNAAANIRDKKLVIGMPLVAGLSLEQLAGVLAHEFGHFCQGVESGVKRRVLVMTRWFESVAYQEDGWDERLHDQLRQGGAAVQIFLLPLQLGSWSTRLVFRLFALIGNAMGGSISHQMEFDADRYEATLVGSDTFESTQKQLRVLGLAHKRSFDDINTYFRDGRLMDNLPGLIAANIGKISAKDVREDEQAIREEKGSIFSSHPTDLQRLRAAQKLGAPGIFRCDLPATALFVDFNALSRAATVDFYYSVFGPMFDPSRLQPLSKMLKSVADEQQAQQSSLEFCAGVHHAIRPINLPTYNLSKPKDPELVRSQIVEDRDVMQRCVDAYCDLLHEFLVADEVRIRTRANKCLSDFDLPAYDEKRKELTPAQTRRAREDAEIEISRLDGLMQTFESAAGRRLINCLNLLKVDSIAQKLDPMGRLGEDCAKMIWGYGRVASQFRSILELRTLQSELHVAVMHVTAIKRDPIRVRFFFGLVDRIEDLAHQIRMVVQDLDYPFDHASGKKTVGSLLLPMASEEPAEIYHAAEIMVTNLTSYAARVLAWLCKAALDVERELGLEPLKAVEFEEE